MPLTTVIEVATGQPDARALRVVLRVTNPAGGTVTILNPDMGIPSAAMHWPFSQAMYQTFLLLSFGFLSMSVTDAAGAQLPRRTIAASATPALRPPLVLGAGDSFDIDIPTGSFYRLTSGNTYQVALEYGDKALRVFARTQMVVP